MMGGQAHQLNAALEDGSEQPAQVPQERTKKKKKKKKKKPAAEQIAKNDANSEDEDALLAQDQEDQIRAKELEEQEKKLQEI